MDELAKHDYVFDLSVPKNAQSVVELVRSEKYARIGSVTMLKLGSSATIDPWSYSFRLYYSEPFYESFYDTVDMQSRYPHQLEAVAQLIKAYAGTLQHDVTFFSIVARQGRR